ncbi:MAG: cation:proton antiporter [Candidatus Anstonellales archaeon]
MDVSVTPLGFLIALTLAFIASFISAKFRLPSVPLLLIIAALAGPNGFSIINQQSIDIFSSIGAILLMYLIGLEMRVDLIKKVGINSLGISIMKMGFTAAVVGAVGMLLFALSPFQALVFGVIFSITSTAIFSKALQDFRIVYGRETTTMYVELIWEDLFAVLFILFTTSFIKTGSVGISALVSMLMFAIPLFLIVGISRMVARHLPENDETYFLFYIALAVVVILVAHVFSVPESIGAFIAGILSSTQMGLKNTIEKMNILTSLFITIFFLSLGMNANILFFLNPVFAFAIIIITLVSCVAKLSSSTLMLIATNNNWAKSALIGLLMISTGEFSMIMAKEFSPAFTIDILSFTAGVVFLSSLLTWVVPGALQYDYTRLLFHSSKKIKEIEKSAMDTIMPIEKNEIRYVERGKREKG